jgi:hypothetical protein
MQISFTTEKRNEIEAIQRKFEQQLSRNIILQSTSQAINGTMGRSISKINKEIKADYNITSKYLKRIAKVSPKSRPDKLYAGIYLAYNPVPMIAFRAKQTKTGVNVTIRKGKPVSVRSAFIATMRSWHMGVFSRGWYEKGKGFVPNKKRLPVTQLMSASPFTMGTSKNIAPKITDFIGKEALRATEGILTARVRKLTGYR